MSWVYRRMLRPMLFAQDAEQAHSKTLRLLKWTSQHKPACGVLRTFYGAPSLPLEVFGLQFPNPVGLAAGMDKSAEAVPAWAALGFGFSELGGVTWHSQPGNSKPRLFRAVADEAIVNRMGFNNPGAEALAQKLSAWRTAGLWPAHPVGINLGKSKITPLNGAAEDYANSFRILREHADFFVVNVSSPNTPGLRQLQDKTALDEILAAIQERNGVLRVACSVKEPATPDTILDATRNTQHAKPILIKVAPDLAFEALDEILELTDKRHVAGIVATNTTLARPETADPSLRRVYAEEGGLSGRPLRTRSTEVIRHLFRQTRGALPIIGVGGIFNAADAWEKITAGASLVQVYTGLVFEGPSLARQIVTDLLKRLKAEGLRDLRQAVGRSAR